MVAVCCRLWNVQFKGAVLGGIKYARGRLGLEARGVVDKEGRHNLINIRHLGWRVGSGLYFDSNICVL